MLLTVTVDRRLTLGIQRVWASYLLQKTIASAVTSLGADRVEFESQVSRDVQSSKCRGVDM